MGQMADGGWRMADGEGKTEKLLIGFWHLLCKCSDYANDRFKRIECQTGCRFVEGGGRGFHGGDAGWASYGHPNTHLSGILGGGFAGNRFFSGTAGGAQSQGFGSGCGSFFAIARGNRWGDSSYAEKAAMIIASDWVLDTNVLVSGLLSANGPPGRLLDAVLSRRLTMAFDDRILQ
jgi:hypothetical protein